MNKVMIDIPNDKEKAQAIKLARSIYGWENGAGRKAIHRLLEANDGDWKAVVSCLQMERSEQDRENGYERG